jgi:hypothetical protein
LLVVLLRLPSVCAATEGPTSTKSTVGDLEVKDELPETGEFNVMIELFDAPTSKVYSDLWAIRVTAPPIRNGTPQLKAQHARRCRESGGVQQRLLAHLGNFGQKAKTLYSVQTAYNGIAARIEASVFPQLRADADVKGVHALPVHYVEGHCQPCDLSRSDDLR